MGSAGAVAKPTFLKGQFLYLQILISSAMCHFPNPLTLNPSPRAERDFEQFLPPFSFREKGLGDEGGSGILSTLYQP